MGYTNKGRIFKSLAPIITKNKSIIEDDESRNKKLIQQGNRKGIDTDKKQIENFLDTVAIEIEQYERLEILKNKNVYIEVVETSEDKTTTNTVSFEDYPPHIQKLAKEILTEK